MPSPQTPDPAKPGSAHAEQLKAVRIAINEVDEQMVGLISRRERLIRRAGSLKDDDESVRAPARVEQVIANVRAFAEKQDVDPTVVERTYRAMIDAFIEYELKVRRAP